ncbi:MAG: hypothetical protein M3Q47_03230 [Actinomycetota bacterium]|nr:hypothetical protein [Actinomycetota bacterium]
MDVAPPHVVPGRGGPPGGHHVRGHHETSAGRRPLSGAAPGSRQRTFSAPARPDASGDVLAVAWAPGLAPPREIRVRPELYDRILTQLDSAVRATVVEHHVLGEPAGVPLAVDSELPPFPGFEVVRVRPRDTAAARPAPAHHAAA